MPIFDPPKRKPKYTLLKNMKVNEVSLVMEPASPGADIIFSKAKDDGPDEAALELLFAKRGRGRPPIDRQAEFDMLMSKAEVGALTARDAELSKRRGIFAKSWSNTEIIASLTPDARPEAERIASAADVLRKCLASPPHEAEKFDAYAARIAQGASLFQTETVVIKGMHAMTSSKQDTVAKAQAALADFAQQIKTNTGCSDAQAFAKAAAAHPAEYLALKSLGAFAVGLGDPLAKSGKPSAVRKAITPGESAVYYTPRSADAAARSGVYDQPDVDGAEVGNVNHENYGDASQECGQISRCAEDIRKASGYTISEQQAFAKACQAMPQVYAAARSKGAYRG